MKILVTGCGSIGSRHAANAAKLAEVAVVDTDAGRARKCAEATGARWFETIDAGLNWHPDGAVIATPHDTHLALARKALNAGADVLIEKPLSHDETGLAPFLHEVQFSGRRAYVVCNMRFHPGPSTLKKHLHAIGKPLFARAHVGNYLPAMRPGADYRQLYAAKRAEGGGVVLDAIHEIDYLMWLFGPIVAAGCHAGRLSDLEIDTEDHAVIALKHGSGVVCSAELDYLRKFKSRGCEIIGDHGVLHWQSDGRQPERCRVRLYRDATGAWEMLTDIDEVDTALPYARLMEEFIGAITGADSGLLLTADAAARELRVALTALRSAAAHGQELAIANGS